MDQTYEDMVANFMARFLDMNLSNVTGPGRQTARGWGLGFGNSWEICELNFFYLKSKMAGWKIHYLKMYFLLKMVDFPLSC